MDNYPNNHYNQTGRGRGRARGGPNPNGHPNNMVPSSSPAGGGAHWGGATRGRGRGRGRAPQPQYVQVGSKQPPVVIDPPTPELQLLKTSQSTRTSSLNEHSQILRVKRPDNGGTSAIRQLRLFVNHFSVQFNPLSNIFQYDLDIKLAVTPKNNRNVVIPKPDMRAVRDKLFSDYPRRYPLSMTAYDGEKSIFSAVELPDGNFRVEVSKGEDCKPQLYEVTIKQVKKLELCKLEAYLTGRIQQIPREILHGMDLVMKENATRHRITICQGFYGKYHDSNNVDLGGGIVASKGFQHSLKPTSQGLVLCVDYSVLPLRKPLPVMEFLDEYLPTKINKQQPLSQLDWRRIGKALRGLKVTVTHRKTKQQYKIEGLTIDKTIDIEFIHEDPEGKCKPEKVKLVDYFWDKYRKKIDYKNLPSLDLSKNKKINYVPMEFCVLVEGQRYPKENLPPDAANTLKHECLAEPKRRMQVICDIVKQINGPCGGEIAEKFEISVTTEMTKVTGRVIKPPDLKLGDSRGKSRRFTVDKEDCHWNLVNKSVLDGKRIDRWAVLDFTSADRYRLKSMPFTDQLIGRCNRLGIQMSKPLFCVPSNMSVLSNTTALRDLLKNVDQRSDQAGRLQILVCVMTRKDPGYKNLKRISETEIGIMTQCCLVNHANLCKDIYLGNLALKINAKLGGSNMELFDELPHFEGNGHVMFIGADVNHPGSWNKSSPSIAAVVATINWPAANKYAARIRPQGHGKEEILNFGEICLELVNMYSRLNKVRPQKIVVFRDGVADNQFDMVLNEELRDLKNSFTSDGYSPTITLVVAQKRHHTRFFPQNPSDVPRNGNVFPGTVIDTEVIHPDDFDFYMCTHYGSLGTSKPTRYTVLYDDHGFNSDEMQKLIYNMCYTFARCTKPVSLVPPVYYADLVAYRGRLYHDALMDSSPTSTVDSSSSSTLSQSSTASSSSSSLVPGFDSRHFKIHSNLENLMFFC